MPDVVRIAYLQEVSEGFDPRSASRLMLLGGEVFHREIKPFCVVQVTLEHNHGGGFVEGGIAGNHVHPVRLCGGCEGVGVVEHRDLVSCELNVVKLIVKFVHETSACGRRHDPGVGNDKFGNFSGMCGRAGAA